MSSPAPENCGTECTAGSLASNPIAWGVPACHRSTDKKGSGNVSGHRRCAPLSCRIADTWSFQRENLGSPQALQKSFVRAFRGTVGENERSALAAIVLP